MAANPQTEPEFATLSSHEPARKKSNTGFFILLVLVILVLAGAVMYELGQRKNQQQALATSTDAASGGVPVVEVARVRTAASGATVEIPGQTVALLETPLYAH